MNAPPNSQNAALFAQIVGLINQGQNAHAEQMLTQVLRRAPNDVDALQLLGLARAQQGRSAEAETLYRRALAMNPRLPHVSINLGALLIGTGRAAEAVALLRPVVRAQPNNVQALVALGQAQQATREYEFAERHLRAALALQPDDAGIALNLGSVCNEAGRPRDAEVVLRAALTRTVPAPMRAALEHNLGVALKLQGRWAEALAAFDAALALAPELPFADANRAGVLAHLKREDDATAGYRRALEKNPLHLAAHLELNALLYRSGRDGEFLASFDAAEKQLGPTPALWLGKGALLNRTERFEEARALFERAAKAQPENPEALNGLALALAGLGRLEDAAGAYAQSLTLRPDDVPARVNLAGIWLRLGEGARAVALTEAASKAAPLDQAALAMHELALRMNRDPRATVQANYDKHVQVFELDLPDGFNEDLNAWLDALHGDAREHIDQTLRRGTQTLEPLFNSDHPLIITLRAKIEEAVSAYIARMDDKGTHPLASRRTDEFEFTGSWSSRLRDQGFHTNHIHPKGWISSVYYVAVPDAVEDGQQGWLKFGEPSFPTPINDAIRRMVKPVPGRLVLFPSYMWHGTVPFRSATARTTIAFDVNPA